MDKKKYSIKCLQRHNGEWVELAVSSILEVNASGDISVRCSSTNSLQVDVPSCAVKTWKLSKEDRLCIPIAQSSNSCNCAFLFNSTEDFLIFSDKLKFHKAECQDIDRPMDSTGIRIQLPDIENPAVQEYIIQLMFDEKFPKFVNDVKRFMQMISTKVN